MAEEKNDFKKKLKVFTFKALKATIKGILVYAVYFVLWMVLAPISTYVPSLQQIVETFFIVYITLMIIGELTSGTIFQHFFNAAKALFVVGYLILSLKGGVFGIMFQNIYVTIDLRLFLATVMLLSLLGLAKSVLQAVNYMSEKTEIQRI